MYYIMRRNDSAHRDVNDREAINSSNKHSVSILETNGILSPRDLLSLSRKHWLLFLNSWLALKPQKRRKNKRYTQSGILPDSLFSFFFFIKSNVESKKNALWELFVSPKFLAWDLLWIQFRGIFYFFPLTRLRTFLTDCFWYFFSDQSFFFLRE